MTEGVCDYIKSLGKDRYIALKRKQYEKNLEIREIACNMIDISKGDPDWYKRLSQSIYNVYTNGLDLNQDQTLLRRAIALKASKSRPDQVYTGKFTNQLEILQTEITTGEVIEKFKIPKRLYSVLENPLDGEGARFLALNLETDQKKIEEFKKRNSINRELTDDEIKQLFYPDVTYIDFINDYYPELTIKEKKMLFPQYRKEYNQRYYNKLNKAGLPIRKGVRKNNKEETPGRKVKLKICKSLEFNFYI